MFWQHIVNTPVIISFASIKELLLKCYSKFVNKRDDLKHLS